MLAYGNSSSFLSSSSNVSAGVLFTISSFSRITCSNYSTSDTSSRSGKKNVCSAHQLFPLDCESPSKGLAATHRSCLNAHSVHTALAQAFIWVVSMVWQSDLIVLISFLHLKKKLVFWYTTTEWFFIVAQVIHSCEAISHRLWSFQQGIRVASL